MLVGSKNHANFLKQRSGSFEGGKSNVVVEDGEYLTKSIYVNRTRLRDCPNAFWNLSQISLSSKTHRKLEKILDSGPNEPSEIEREIKRKKILVLYLTI